MIEQLIADLKEIIQRESVYTANEEVEALCQQLEALNTVKEDDSGAEAATSPEELEEEAAKTADKDPLIIEWEDLLSKYKSRHNLEVKNKKEQTSKNLNDKREIIAILNALIKDEDNIGSAHRKFRELRDKWQNIGDVPMHKVNEVNGEYRTLVEFFYYNINIYQELKDHDLKRNLELRKELVIEIQKCLVVDRIKEMQKIQRECIQAWDKAGPVNKEDWAILREEFFDAYQQVGAKIKDYYADQKQRLADNLVKKEAICERAESMIEQNYDSVKQWNTATKGVLDLQKQWKAVGFADKKKGNKLWERFRISCDSFFTEKNNFFEGLKESGDKNKERKLAIIERANSKTFSDSDDSVYWKDLTEFYIRLQKEWKNIGPASQRDEQPLWKKFRDACDKFFDTKKKYYDGLDSRLEDNLKAVEKIIAEISKLDAKKSEVDDLTQLVQKFSQKGKVPQKKAHKLEAEFNKAVLLAAKSLNMDADKADKFVLESKIESHRGTDGFREFADKEIGTLRAKISEINSEIIQYENNLGFFGLSKGAEALKNQVIEKIDASKVQKTKMEDKLKWIKKQVDLESRDAVKEA